VIPIEVDFFFETPKSTNEIDFFVYIAYWKIPGTHEYTSNIAEGRNCTSLNLQSCPAVSGGNYTLKSQIYVDPLLSFLTKKTVWNSEKKLVGIFSNCFLNDFAWFQGEVLTSWKLTVGNKFRTGKNFSQCFFSVQANITYEWRSVWVNSTNSAKMITANAMVSHNYNS